MENMEITERDMETLACLIEDQAGGNCRVDSDTAYSGRGMMGSQCVGFVTDLGDFALGLHLGAVLQRIAEDGPEAEDLDPEFDALGMMEDILNFRTDSMGYDAIVYFPRITCSDYAV